MARKAVRPQLEAGIEIPNEVITEFEKRPIDEETNVVMETYHEIDGKWLLLELWSFDNIWAKSWIVPKRHFPEAEVSAVERWLRKHTRIEGRTTHGGNKTADFFFINFGFRHGDDDDD